MVHDLQNECPPITNKGMEINNRIGPMDKHKWNVPKCMLSIS